jgi:hypothetical protein
MITDAGFRSANSTANHRVTRFAGATRLAAMKRCLLTFLLSIAGLSMLTADLPLVQRRWIEAHTAHCNIYSCAPLQNIYGLANQLEQFSEAYKQLAGAQAVVSPPIEVLAFPDQESMKPFLPLHDGKPSNIAGFFRRGDDANLIVLAVPGSDSAFSQLQVILHEYAHLLFRHNGRIWPMWLNEGMADIYSTFQAGGYRATIAQPIRPYLIQLSQRPWMPLKELFEVNHDSPQYNEGERQGTFYAESWLLNGGRGFHNSQNCCAMGNRLCRRSRTRCKRHWLSLNPSFTATSKPDASRPSHCRFPRMSLQQRQSARGR